MVHTTVNNGADVATYYHSSSSGDRRGSTDNAYADWVNDMRVGFYEEADYGSDIGWSGVGSGVNVETTFHATPSKGVIYRRKNTNANSGKVREYTYDGSAWVSVEYSLLADYFTEVARGNVSGAVAIEKFGRNSDVDAATPEDVWDNGGTFEPFTNGEQTCNIVSTSTNDDGDPAGTGARTLSITGISGGVITTESITLNGTTNVVTANAYTMIHRIEVLTVGSLGSNEGIITAKGTTDTGETIASIGATHNQTRMAIYQVCSGGKGIARAFYIEVNAGTAATTLIIIEILEKKNGSNTPWVTKHIAIFNSDLLGHEQHRFFVNKAFNALSFIKIRITSSKNNADISAGFDLVDFDN